MKNKDFKKIGKNVIDLEIQALKKLKQSINNSFNQAVQAIVKCQSKIIFCGVGKSSKISANNYSKDLQTSMDRRLKSSTEILNSIIIS